MKRNKHGKPNQKQNIYKYKTLGYFEKKLFFGLG